MKRLLAVLLVGHALACGVALAEPAPKPEVVEEVDLLRAQLAESQAQEAKTRAEALQILAMQARDNLRAKYRLGDGDGIDPQTRVIRRAPKPDKKPAK
jgi:hypothetical protein